MIKLRSLFNGSFHYLCIISVIALGLITIIGSGGGGGGGGDATCNNSVPCLNADWNGVYYEFRETNGGSIIATSQGTAFGGAGITDEGWIIGLGGPPTDCYNGTFTEGGLDYDLDGVVDYWFASVNGNVNICNDTLRITNIVLDGTPDPDIVATYFGPASVYTGHTEREIPPEILYEVMDKLNREY